MKCRKETRRKRNKEGDEKKQKAKKKRNKKGAFIAAWPSAVDKPEADILVVGADMLRRVEEMVVAGVAGAFLRVRVREVPAQHFGQGFEVGNVVADVVAATVAVVAVVSE